MMADLAPPPFGATVDFGDLGAVVRLRGDIDMSTAPDLAALLEAVRSRHTDVIVDATGLQFMDGRGVAVLARAAAAIRDAGGQLVVRAPAASTRWLIEATGLDEVVQVEPAGDDDEAREALRRVAAFPADQAVLRAALRLVVELTETMVPGTDAATISLAPRGRLRDVITGHNDLAVLDREQYAIGEGPCYDAAEERAPMHVTATATERRWPTFMPRAMERGVNSMLSTPLRSTDGAFGALNMYAFRGDAFPPQSHDLAGTLADRAAHVLQAAAIGVADEDTTAHLQSALQTRQSIALAQGVLVERGHVAPDAAYAALRRMSKDTSRPLQDVAGDVVVSAADGPRPPEEDGDAHISG